MISELAHAGVLRYFHFWPSRDLSIIALSLFLLASLTVLAMTIRTRAWYMLVAVMVGGLESAGYVCRILMFNSPTYGAFVAMQCLLIIPPSFLALVQYLTLGKVVTAVQLSQPDVKLPIRGSIVTWVYLAVEFGSLALQAAGAGLSVSNTGRPKHASLGKGMLLVGLALLVAVMVTYIINAIYVHSRPIFGVRRSSSLTRLFATLYVSTLLLLVRNIFRMIEFTSGWYGTLARDETLFYILDALMIFLILCVFTLSHYGIYFAGYRREQELEAGVKPGLRGKAIEVASKV